jgi:four helix bundle protein
MKKAEFNRNEEGRMKNEETNLLTRTKMFARRVIRLYVSLSKGNTVAQILGKQVLRSGTSVGANYREANRARSKAEFISKMGECLREADETLYWLELLLGENVVPPAKFQPLFEKSNELASIFVTIVKNARGHT